MRKCLVIILVIFAPCIHADIISPFGNLKKVSLPPTSEYQNAIYYLDGNVLDVKSNGLYGDELIANALQTYPKKGMDPIVIGFSLGASDDPGFYFYSNRKQIGVATGDQLVVPGDGYFYISGAGDDMFDRKRKYMIKEGVLVEVTRAPYFIGIESVAKRDIQLFSDRDLKVESELIKKGDKLVVVINDGDCYLIRNSLGLVGWMKIPAGTSAWTTPIKDLYYHGD